MTLLDIYLILNITWFCRIITGIFRHELLHFSVCELVQLGVAGIFGPQNEASIRHVNSMCDALGIPHISTTINTDDTLKILNLYPHARTLSMVLHLIQKF